MKRSTVALLTIAMTVTVAIYTVRGQDTQAQSTAVTRSSADPQTFVTGMALAGMAEVHLGNLASERASDADVRAFAQMMVKDHAMASRELEQIASQLGLQVPKEFDEKHRVLADRLMKLDGAEFDREYVTAMVQGHDEVAAKLRTRAGGSSAAGTPGAVGTAGAGDDDRPLEKWAAKTLPTVEQHLAKAKELQQKVAR